MVFGSFASGPLFIFSRPLTRVPVEHEDDVVSHLGAPKPLSKEASCAPPPEGDATGDVEEGASVIGAGDTGAALTGADEMGAEVMGASVGEDVTGESVGEDVIGASVGEGVGNTVGCIHDRRDDISACSSILNAKWWVVPYLLCGGCGGL